MAESVKTAHQMKLDLLHLIRTYAKTENIALSVETQGGRHLARALGRAMAHLTIEAGAPAAAAVGLTVEGVQNALSYKDETIEAALGAPSQGDA